MRWLLLLALLLTTPALAQEGSGETGSDTDSDENGDEGDEASPAPGAEEAPGTDADEAAPAPDAEAAPAPASSSEASPWSAAAVEEKVEVEEDVREERRADRKDRRSSRLEKMAARRAKLPLRFQVLLGGGTDGIQDEGLQTLGSPGFIQGPRLMLEVFFHPQIGVSVDLGAPVLDTFELGDSSGASNASLQLQIASFNVAAKVILAPQWFFLRPYVRAGGGAAEVQVLGDSGAGGNLGSREAVGRSPFGQVGGGIEIGTPRKAGDVVHPWSVGVYFEGAARFGGGGDLVPVPGVDLGTWGKVDLGMGAFRAGLVLTF